MFRLANSSLHWRWHSKLSFIILPIESLSFCIIAMHSKFEFVNFISFSENREVNIKHFYSSFTILDAPARVLHFITRWLMLSEITFHDNHSDLTVTLDSIRNSSLLRLYNIGYERLLHYERVREKSKIRLTKKRSNETTWLRE